MSDIAVDRPPPATLVMHWAKSLLAQLPDEGTQGFVLERAGVTRAQLEATHARIAYDAAMRLVAAFADASGDEDCGLHFGEHVDAPALGVVGYFAAASETVDSALQRVVAYHRLLKDPGQIDIVRSDEAVTIIELPPPGFGQWPRHFAEAVICAYVTCLRAWSGKTWVNARAVAFQHERPAKLREHQRILGCVPEFGAAANTVSFDLSVLELRLERGDAALAPYLRIAADHELAALPQREALRMHLERAILAALPDGTPSIGRIARAMGMASRTLQRRLTERGTSFQDVVDEVRRTASQRLLDDERLTVAEVAFLLGFSDASGFQRAHRRWTGKPPRRKAPRERPAAS